jgi:hypothetical protein
MFVCNKNIEILTSSGFKQFRGLQRLEKETIKILFSDGNDCTVSTDHIFIDTDKPTKELRIGDFIGEREIIDIKKQGLKKVYDPVDVEGHEYIGNGINHHNCEFLGSSLTVLNSETLRSLLSQEEYDIIEESLGGRLRIYEKPIEGVSYVIGVDTSKGTGNDFSVAQVFKVSSIKPVGFEQVAVFQDDFTDAYSFSDIVNKLGYYYNNAYIMVENNAEGSTVVSRLWWEYEYENLVCTGTKTKDLGIRATITTKPKAVLLMKKLIESGSLKLRDYKTIQELTDFIDKGNGKFGGQTLHDDLVSALYWASYIFELDVFDESFEFKKEEEEEDGWGILSSEENDVELF